MSDIDVSLISLAWGEPLRDVMPGIVDGIPIVEMLERAGSDHQLSDEEALAYVEDVRAGRAGEGLSSEMRRSIDSSPTRGCEAYMRAVERLRSDVNKCASLSDFSIGFFIYSLKLQLRRPPDGPSSSGGGGGRDSISEIHWGAAIGYGALTVLLGAATLAAIPDPVPGDEVAAGAGTVSAWGMMMQNLGMAATL